MPVPTSGFGVVTEQELFVNREATPGTIPASVGVPELITDFTPTDDPQLYDDKSYQGSMADFYGEYQGPTIGGWNKAGQVYGDTFGYDLFGILGDLTESGTSASPSGTTNGSVAAGATALPVASGGGSFTAGMYLWIEDAGTPAANEVVKVGNGSTSNSIVLATGTRFAHATATPFTNTQAPYTHVFSALNGSIGAWNGPAQPPSLCYTHLTGLPASVGARQYAYACHSEIVMTLNSEKLAAYTAKGVCLESQLAGSPVSPQNANGAPAIASWVTTVGFGGPASGGSLFPSFDELSFTIGRHLHAQNTLRGAQAPYIIGRGELAVSGKLSVMPAVSEAVLLDFLANTQPQLQSITSNGLSGASLVSVQVDIALTAIQKSNLKKGDVFFGYDVPFKCPGNSLTGLSGVPGGAIYGASGGKSAVKVTLMNAIPSYAN